MKKSSQEQEEKQGNDMVDAAIANGVRHFVYTSVDRGGAQSDTNPTYVPHFISKHHVEQYLKAESAKTNMIWTILRPVGFLDALEPDFFGKVLGTILHQMGDKKLQFVSTKDIGVFAAMALTHPETFKNRAISLAGDEVNFKEADQVYRKLYNRHLPTTFSLLATGLRWMVPDLGLMVKWFIESGYGANIDECRRIYPKMQTLEMWLKESSKHQA